MMAKARKPKRYSPEGLTPEHIAVRDFKVAKAKEFVRGMPAVLALKAKRDVVSSQPPGLRAGVEAKGLDDTWMAEAIWLAKHEKG